MAGTPTHPGLRIRARRMAAALALACAAVAGDVRASVQLAIPCRAQWDDRNGYCGECTIQSIALYYGTYISQYRVREIISSNQTQDVWVPDHTGTIFDALRLNYENWNSGLATPQYQNYLVWTKAHLQQGHPVMITLFVQGESDTDYDHIVPATGFTSVDTTAYHAADTLVFNDNYDSSSYSRTFGSIYDTRAMTGNGATYEYCIPRDTDYGAAVTGIRDASGTALPVSVSVDRWDEPNVWRGEPLVQMNATIQVRTLTTGASYVLRRYDDYHLVPTNNYLSSACSSSTSFVATAATQTLSDHFSSGGTVIYRCVPAAASPPAAPAVASAQATGTGFRLAFATQTNRLYGIEYKVDLGAATWTGLTNGVAGTGGTLTLTDAGATNQLRRFYRVFISN